MSQALLLDERVIALQPALIRALDGDVLGAIVLQQIAYWMPYATSEYDGHSWIWKTHADLAAETALSTDQCFRATKRLEAMGVLVACQPEGNNRTKWYRIDYSHPALNGHSMSRNRDMHVAQAHVASRESAISSLSTKEYTESTSLEKDADLAIDADALPSEPRFAEQEPTEDQERVAVEKSSAAAAKSATCQRVFEAWLAAVGKNPKTTKLTKQRRSKITARLAEGYAEGDLLDAVRGISLSAFHRGDNDRGTKYDDLTVALRDGSQVEKFCELWRSGGEQRRTKMDQAFDDLDAVLPEGYEPGSLFGYNQPKAVNG